MGKKIFDFEGMTIGDLIQEKSRLDRMESLKGKISYAPIYPQMMSKSDVKNNQVTVLTNIMISSNKWVHLSSVLKVDSSSFEGLSKTSREMAKSVMAISNKVIEYLENNFEGAKIRKKPKSFEVIDKDMEHSILPVQDGLLATWLLDMDELLALQKQALEQN